jgi:hypothetical protein
MARAIQARAREIDANRRAIKSMKTPPSCSTVCIKPTNPETLATVPNVNEKCCA